jgi:protein ImuA
MLSKKVSLLRDGLARPALTEATGRACLGYDPVDQALKGGLRRGALHEVFASAGHEAAATGFTAGLVARMAMGRQVFWISQEFASREYGAFCPPGFFEFGLDPSRFIFLSAVRLQDTLRAAGDALACAGLGAVVVEIMGNPKALDLTASRRLVLASARNSVPSILLRLGATPQASAAETRWLVKTAPSSPEINDWGQPMFDVSLIRNRQGWTGQWVFSWSCDDGRFEEAKAAFGAVVSTPANRQAEAA